MEFYKQYPSGLRLVAKYLDNFYTVATGVYVNVGSIRETAETNGLSHFQGYGAQNITANQRGDGRHRRKPKRLYKQG